MNISPIGLNNPYNASSIADTAKVHTEQQAKAVGLSDRNIKDMKRKGSIECETCANRKYQDGSDENVSFKSASHVSPEAAAGAVRAHEQEHVANAYDDAKQNNGKVISANVQIHTSICPECGRTYVSGGDTTTQIKYTESNPYSANAKSMDYANMVGQRVDYGG